MIKWLFAKLGYLHKREVIHLLRQEINNIYDYEEVVKAYEAKDWQPIEFIIRKMDALTYCITQMEHTLFYGGLFKTQEEKKQ
jgi:hypothetical protein